MTNEFVLIGEGIDIGPWLKSNTESKSMPSVTNRCLDELQMLICVNVKCQKTLVIIEYNHFHIAIWHPTLTLFFEPSRIYERQVLKHFDCREVLTSLVMNQKTNMTKTTIPSRTKQSSGMKSGISKAMKRPKVLVLKQGLVRQTKMVLCLTNLL